MTSCILICSVDESTSPEEATQCYNHVLSTLLDRHAPARNVTIPDRHNADWYTPELRAAKQERRRAEDLWRKSNLKVHEDAFRIKKNDYNYQVREARSKYLQEKIRANANNPRQLFNVTSKLMGTRKTRALPSSRSDACLAEDFASFFTEKIILIRDSIDDDVAASPIDGLEQCDSILETWPPATVVEVERIIRTSSTKSCPLDPIPIDLLKDSLDALLPSITSIINLSLSTGLVPPALKVARVAPTLKKTNLDHNELNNYRPVSNLTFLSKILEKVVLSRFSSHLSINNLHDPHQSAYKSFYSTETALLRVQNDVLNSLGNQRPCLLALLDLTAAFDTVDHDILLKVLQKQGIGGTALDWFQSYLTDRQQYVSIGGHDSTKHHLSSGVPQGSVLGPVLFNAYTASLGSIFTRHGMKYQVYADDASVFLSFEHHQMANAFERMGNCIQEVKRWMSAMRLKMNCMKTEAIVLASRHQSCSIGNIPVLHIGDSRVEVSRVVRSLGVLLDQSLTFKDYINNVCKSARLHLYNIRRIRHLLPQKECEQLIHSFVFSRIDYGNCLLYGLPKNELHKLQLVLNSAARIVRRIPRQEHITPTLAALHWLPVATRIDFKIALLTYKALHEMAPSYLRDLLTEYEPSRLLRSASSGLLVIPPTHSALQRRAFTFAAPTVWNSLPLHVREAPSIDSFKSRLKTQFYIRSYSSTF
mgnify:CR=1 FL=1